MKNVSKIELEKWHFNTESYGLVVKVTPMLHNFGPPGFDLCSIVGCGSFDFSPNGRYLLPTRGVNWSINFWTPINSPDFGQMVHIFL